ncbi:MAG: MBL fold metallo-hydrolase [Chloroflexota bacterium]|nr:MBL fold metallo-hydrolase [Chloroflexota bacterium]
MAEVQPGLHQIEQELGGRYLFQYLLLGERSMLVDTGIASSPDEVILPYFEQIGFDPSNLDYIVISHADVDHFGGNARMREVAPQAILATHRLDAHWVGDRERILKERYGWFKQFDMDYPTETAEWLEQAMGPDVRIDLLLGGDEIFMLDDDRPVHVLHLPGHSEGHIGLYDERNRSLIIIDAILERGLYSIEGELMMCPPYFAIQPYLDAIDRLLELDFEHLYTAHYSNRSGEEARRFLEESKAYVRDCHQTVYDILTSSGRRMTLSEVRDEVDRRLGPYPAFGVELAKPVYAHLEELVSEGRVARDKEGQQTAWYVQ